MGWEEEREEEEGKWGREWIRRESEGMREVGGCRRGGGRRRDVRDGGGGEESEEGGGEGGGGGGGGEVDPWSRGWEPP